jgi:outer membrane immunogenic protein
VAISSEESAVKGLFVQVVALCSLAAVPALAADLSPARAPMSYKAPPNYVPPPTWTGCYIGGNVGAAFDHTYVHDETPPFEPIATLNDTAIAGGGQVGCDFQFPNSNFVIGVQGMYDRTDLSASGTSAALGPDSLNGKVPYFATLTGRLGYAVAPDWLIYGKGGAAWTRVDATITPFAPDSLSGDLSGWVGGGGVEWRVARYLSLFAEYDYMGFADKLIISASGANEGIVQQHDQAVLVGANLRFGP